MQGSVRAVCCSAAKMRRVAYVRKVQGRCAQPQGVARMFSLPRRRHVFMLPGMERGQKAVFARARRCSGTQNMMRKCVEADMSAREARAAAARGARNVAPAAA